LALWRQLGLVKRLHIFEELLKKKSEVILKLAQKTNATNITIIGLLSLYVLPVVGVSFPRDAQ